MTDDIEKLSTRRSLILLLLATFYLMWQVFSMEWIRGSEIGANRIFESLKNLGQLGFVLGLTYLIAMGRKVIGRSSVATKAGLEDDLVKSNRLNATKIGYITMMVATFLLFVITRFQDISGADISRLMLAIGVAAPLYAFAILERKNA